MSTTLSPASVETPVAGISSHRARIFRTLELIGRLAALGAVVLFFWIVVPGSAFLSAGNVENVFRQTAVFAMCGMGMTMVIITGGIDLAAGSNIALSMVVTAMILGSGEHHSHLKNNPLLWTVFAVLGGTAASMLVGMTQGLLITSLRLVPFIVTLGGLEAIRGLTKGIADNQEISPPSDNWLFRQLMFPVQGRTFSWELFPLGVWATLVAAVLAAGLLRYTRLGRRIYAIGSNEATARLCGVPVVRTKIAVYAIAGLFAGLAGVLEFSKLNLGQPTGAQSYELYVIAGCVIGGASLTGGIGTIYGTMIGMLIIGTLNAGAQQAGWPKWVQELVIGVIIIAAAALDSLRPRKE